MHRLLFERYEILYEHCFKLEGEDWNFFNQDKNASNHALPPVSNNTDDLKGETDKKYVPEENSAQSNATEVESSVEEASLLNAQAESYRQFTDESVVLSAGETDNLISCMIDGECHV